MNLTLDFLGMPGPGTARGAQIWLGRLAVGNIAIRGLAIGDTTLFLIIAAVVGISYTGKELNRGR